MYSEKKRVLAFVLAMLLILRLGASFVLADGETEKGELSGGGLCEHHPIHTPECGYQEPDEAVRALMNIRKNVMSWMRTENRS